MTADGASTHTENNIYFGDSGLVVLIMAGGDGLRLGLDKPKQFVQFFQKGGTLLQDTYKRCMHLHPKAVYVSTNQKHKSVVREQLPQAHCIGEPTKRNTAASLAWSMNVIGDRYGDETVVLCVPSDHWVGDLIEYVHTMSEAYTLAKDEKLVTIGIKPAYAHTGYGYIERNNSTKHVESFLEKPEAARAEELIKQGCLWNSGMFMWTPKAFMYEFNKVDIRFSVSGQEINEYFTHVPSMSIDYALLEKCNNVYCETGNFGWTDLGTWESIKSSGIGIEDPLVPDILARLMVEDEFKII
jgi:mannose-1-phosphate guanylyltransferase